MERAGSRCPGAEKEDEYQVTVRPSDGLHFTRQFEVGDKAGIGPLDVSFDLQRGIPVKGTCDRRQRPTRSRRDQLLSAAGERAGGTRRARPDSPTIYLHDRRRRFVSNSGFRRTGRYRRQCFRERILISDARFGAIQTTRYEPRVGRC